MLSVEQLGQIDPRIGLDLFRKARTGDTAIQESLADIRAAAVRPWYVKYKWPLIIGGIGLVGIAVYTAAK